MPSDRCTVRAPLAGIPALGMGRASPGVRVPGAPSQRSDVASLGRARATRSIARH